MRRYTITAAEADELVDIDEEGNEIPYLDWEELHSDHIVEAHDMADNLGPGTTIMDNHTDKTIYRSPER